jgi:Amt family ammonium transporter
LGATLERARLLAIAFCCYLFGVVVYPLLANWVWGGGWLAELGREFHLGNGFVDQGGAGVVHLSAGVLALVLAITLGPRHGRFGRDRPSFAIPGHNVPFIVSGSLVLLLSWTATNAALGITSPRDAAASDATSTCALAAVNTLLAAAGGALASFLQAGWQRRRPEPARLCRGLLAGAIASSGATGLMDAWAAFLVGAVGALLVQAAVVALERRRIDDPTSAAATHGAAGLWGVLATGLFANGSAGAGLNGVAEPVRGLFFGGGVHQLGAQLIGAISGVAVIALLGWASIGLVHKILGLRADSAEEMKGLDWSEVGALGYQGDEEE